MNLNTHHSSQAERQAAERKQALTQELLERYGPMVGGVELRAVLKFRTASAFYKSLNAGRLGVHVFHLEGRSGLFCMTAEIAEWMCSVSQKPSDAPPQPEDDEKPPEGDAP